MATRTGYVASKMLLGMKELQTNKIIRNVLIINLVIIFGNEYQYQNIQIEHLLTPI